MPASICGRLTGIPRLRRSTPRGDGIGAGSASLLPSGGPDITRRFAQKGRCTVPSRLRRRHAPLLAALLVAIPGQVLAQPYGPVGYGMGWHGWHGGAAYAYHGYVGRSVYGGYPIYYGYRGYGGYRPYYRYVPYPPYYGLPGAGIVGVMIGSVIAPPPVYVYPAPPPPPPPPAPAAPATQQCPDGSIIVVGSSCPAPAQAAPAPIPQPAPERG